jgi:hypothetical protein
VLLANAAVAHSLGGRHEEARTLARRLGTISMVEYAGVLRAFAVALAGAATDIPNASGSVAPAMTYVAAAAIVTRDHERALAVAADLERHVVGGSHLYAALVEAIREEVARDSGGPPPTHALLNEIGYVGWSELLSARA